MLKKKITLVLATVLALCLVSCGAPEAPEVPDVSEPDTSAILPLPDISTPEPDISEPEPDVSTPEPEVPLYPNPLTGEMTEVDLVGQRPIAIMMNNHRQSLPQEGISEADIIYECPAEGGITRMLAVFQGIEGAEQIGSVRSARTYYVELAAGLDSIFMHAGGSPGAYQSIKDLGMTALDCVNGPYEGSLYWRDADRKENAGYEHSVVTSSAVIESLFPTYSNLREEHKEGYEAPFTFVEAPMSPNSAEISSIEVSYANNKTDLFEYDAETGLYGVSQYGGAYLDGNTDEQLTVKNVFVVRTDISRIAGDTAGRLDVDLIGSGEGFYFCDGKAKEIIWEKASATTPLIYKNMDGTELNIGIGTSYVNIIGQNYELVLNT